MTAYVARRLLLLPFILLAISFIVFMLMRAVPGDPAIAIAGEKASPEELERVRKDRGFDKPLLVQYGIYVGKLVRGDLGESYKTGERVSDEIKRHFPATVELTLASLLIALVGGLGFGILAAVYKGTWLDYTSMTVALAGVSVPVFWLGFLLLLAFGDLFPTGGNVSDLYNIDRTTGFYLIDTLLMGRGDIFLNVLWHLALPSLALSTLPMAITARITRSSMLEALGSDYIRTARAKGVAIGGILLRHALRNALIPIITLVGLEFGFLLGGAVLTETVFDRRVGMGKFILNSVERVEYESIGGAVLVLAAAFVLVNLLVDVLYAFIDPRIRYGSAEAKSPAAS